MNKTELIEVLATKTESTKKDAERFVNAVIEVVTETLAKGEEISIAGLGKFEVRQRAARTGRNPKTGEEIQIPAQKSPAFKAGKQLKDAVKN